MARRSKQFDAWLPAVRRRAAARTTSRSSPPTTAATPRIPGTDHSREYVPLLASGPQVRRGVNLGVRAHAFRHRPDRGREFRREHRARRQLSYSKSYEKTSHGGQLEDVQDARRNHRILREVPAAGREVRALRDRDLSSFHEPAPRPWMPRKGTRIRIGAQNIAWAKEGAFTGEISGAMIARRRRHARDRRPQRAPAVFRRDRRDGPEADAGGA